MRALAPLLAIVGCAAATLAAAGCGGGGAPPAPGITGPITQPIPRQAPGSLSTTELANERVIDAWTAALRRGDLDAAAATFALPTRVSNGDTPRRLRTRAEVRQWNADLTCGAHVIGAVHAPNRYLRVTFQLAERQGGPGCGTGIGGLAVASIRVRDGHITDWIRRVSENPGFGLSSGGSEGPEI